MTHERTARIYPSGHEVILDTRFPVNTCVRQDSHWWNTRPNCLSLVAKATGVERLQFASNRRYRVVFTVGEAFTTREVCLALAETLVGYGFTVDVEAFK